MSIFNRTIHSLKCPATFQILQTDDRIGESDEIATPGNHRIGKSEDAANQGLVGEGKDQGEVAKEQRREERGAPLSEDGVGEKDDMTDKGGAAPSSTSYASFFMKVCYGS